jgi:L-2,4-diaminobutyric acid acetyltransferase
VADDDLSPETIVDPRIRMPVPTDGPAVHALVASCPPLDTNSLYCNVLQCTHFAATCALAERDGEVVGWVGGYLLPASPDTLFVWQVAVSAAARGRGLARALVLDILRRPACRAVRHVQATVTEANESSWRMFRSVAETLGAPCERAPGFARDRHFGGRHASELLLRIGPFDPPRTQTVEV